LTQDALRDPGLWDAAPLGQNAIRFTTLETANNFCLRDAVTSAVATGGSPVAMTKATGEPPVATAGAAHLQLQYG